MAQISPRESEAPFGSACDQVLHEYTRHLEHDRGLAAETIRRSGHVARDLLRERFGSGPLLWDQLLAPDVTQFLLRCIGSVKASTGQRIACDLRRFLRYLRADGKTTLDLASAVPPVASPSSTGKLPVGLEPEEVTRLLASCDQASPIGLRDFAILLLLARLGLRGGEVAALELTDIDWRAGVLAIRGKGPRVDRLPLPQDVGEAMAAYLQEARPVCASPHVFLRLRPPIVGFPSSASVSSIVRAALRRAGLAPKHKGAHMLRHSLATEMLRKGARLEEIGQILRHRRPATTEIYARVDLTALQELAQPWPGGER